MTVIRKTHLLWIMFDLCLTDICWDVPGCLPRNALKMVRSGPRSTEKRPKQQICTEASLFLQTNRVHKALWVGSNAFQHVWSGSRSVFGSGPDSKSDLGRMQARQVRIPVGSRIESRSEKAWTRKLLSTLGAETKSTGGARSYIRVGLNFSWRSGGR